jgi:hypothetical protein
MLNNILNYIEKNKIIFSVIVIFLFIVLIITYKKNYDNFENISTNTEQEIINPLNIDSITMPNIDSTNMLLTTITFNDEKGNTINQHFILGIYKLNDCINLNSEDHNPECKNNIPILIPYDTYIIMKTKYLSDKNTYDMNCHQLCSQNISEECNCPKINLQYIVDFQINKGTMPNRYIISGKQRDTIDNNNKLITGNKFILSNNLYNQEQNNELYRHLCYDNVINGTDETEILFEPSNEPLKYYIVFTKSINDKIIKFYVGQTDIDIYNTCQTGIFKFKRLALHPNKEHALKFILI